MAEEENTRELARGTAKNSSLRARRYALKNWRRILVGLALLALLVLVYGYVHTRQELNRLKNPQTATQDETKNLVNQVGQLIILPEGETPTVATVKDATKLKNQEFFARAQNGDKVLIYSKSGRAVLYRPSTDKVVEYSKVNLNSTQ
jgi:hypothetical protein